MIWFSVSCLTFGSKIASEKKRRPKELKGGGKGKLTKGKLKGGSKGKLTGWSKGEAKKNAPVWKDGKAMLSDYFVSGGFI